MLNVVFFARVKEQLGCASLQLPWDDALSSFAGLRFQLTELKGPKWEEVLSEENIILAVNHTVVDESAVLNDGDEVAFFPPVTGG
ncbi:MAG: molybdopterin converting factor subunit 1 [Halioglobus sp.]